MASLAAVDRGIASILGELRRLDQLDRTMVVFTSDNGYFYGEHGIREGKQLPYEPALRIPLAITPPSDGRHVSRPAAVEALVSNVDLAPTLLDFARARPCSRAGCRPLDGRSLRPLLAGRRPDWIRNRAIPIELDDDFAYRALRTPRFLYLELTRDPIGALSPPEVELYDLRSDPAQVHNLWAEDRADNRRRQRRLARRLRAISECVGTHGRIRCP